MMKIILKKWSNWWDTGMVDSIAGKLYHLKHYTLNFVQITEAVWTGTKLRKI